MREKEAQSLQDLVNPVVGLSPPPPRFRGLQLR